MISLATNLLILVLLAGVMGYAMLLSRRVARLMDALQELGPMVAAFSAAVDKSEQSVAELKGATDEALRGAAEATVAEAAALRDAVAPVSFSSVRRRPVAGMTRLTGKSDLVKSFFERSRTARGEAAGQW
ncbi:hypothetical protein GCM10008024_06040 [Allgaiera indica]|uniref:Flagellar motor switch protein n=1 Tax=Allgaiera indica TaxID=765699 RepID=A0AAN4UP07_9RHOB|nr:hypothetical protein [Allgaiera indica]GHD99282.1 hypothetical protein GCM10008024_06040 [Allgaiera indica]SDW29784.1 hypothetical protein SAMN05444006_102271 [Allgaiera indica]